MSDFAVKITVRNNRILKAIRALGYESVKRFCRECGVDYNRTVQALGFRCRVTAFGEWNDFAYNLSSALHCEPEDLWPEHMKHLKTRKNSIEFSTDEVGIRSLAAQSNASTDAKLLHQFIAELPERTGHVLAERWGLLGGGEKTLEDVAQIFGVQRERIRQIEAKGMRIIKERFRKRGIKEARAMIDEPPSLNI